MGHFADGCRLIVDLQSEGPPGGLGSRWFGLHQSLAIGMLLRSFEFETNLPAGLFPAIWGRLGAGIAVPKRLQPPIANADLALLQIMSSLQAHRTRLRAFLGREGAE